MCLCFRGLTLCCQGKVDLHSSYVVGGHIPNRQSNRHRCSRNIELLLQTIDGPMSRRRKNPLAVVLLGVFRHLNDAIQHFPVGVEGCCRKFQGGVASGDGVVNFIGLQLDGSQWFGLSVRTTLLEISWLIGQTCHLFSCGFRGRRQSMDVRPKQQLVCQRSAMLHIGG